MKPEFIILGIGNHGKTYAATRHNIGWWALDAVAKECATGDFREAGKFRAQAAEARVVTVPLLLLKPETYVNLSGESARSALDFYQLDPSRLIVLCDDVDLSLGTLRYRESGGPGTHNGLKSIVEHCGEGFPRIRIGLGKPTHGEDLAAWVLSVPPAEEKKVLVDACQKIPAFVRAIALGEPLPSIS